MAFAIPDVATCYPIHEGALMANPQPLTIVCDVDLPRDDANTGIPTAWIDDAGISFSAKGLIFEVATYPVGTAKSEAEFRQHPEDPPLAELVAELEAAGYLIHDDVVSNRYRLVHPDRLEPPPSFKGPLPPAGRKTTIRVREEA